MSILPKSHQWLDLLVNGYIMDAFGIYPPNIVVHKIIMFYNTKNNTPFNVYNYNSRLTKWNKINNNNDRIIEMYNIGSSQFYVSNDNKLFINGQNFNKRHGTDIKFANFDEHKFYRNKYIHLMNNSQNCFHSIVCADNKIYGAGLTIFWSIKYDRKNSDPIIMCNDVNKTFKSPIKQIATGLRHTLFLTENGNVYGYGDNNLGQLGLKDVGHKYSEITLITAFNNIDSICCQSKTSYILDNKGKMYSFGRNNRGSLGVVIPDIVRYTTKLKEIKTDNKIRYICAGGAHVCFIDIKDELYAFGFNGSNQCGKDGTNEYISIPKKVSFNQKCADMKCGSDYNIIKTNNHDYYSFGLNNEHQCLIFGDNSKKILEPKNISLKVLKQKIGNNNDIIDLKPVRSTTFVIQKI